MIIWVVRACGCYSPRIIGSAALGVALDLALPLLLPHLAQVHPPVLLLLRHCVPHLHHLILVVQLLYQVPEGLVHVLPGQGAHREELALVLPLEVVDLFLEGLELLLEFGGGEEVALVAEEEFGDIVAAVHDQLLEPGLGVGEGVLVGEVEHHDCGLGEVEVVVDDGAVALLPGRVPQLEVEGVARVLHLLEAVVDAYGGLLRVVAAVDVAQQQGALPHRRPPDDDRFVVDQPLVQIVHYGDKNTDLIAKQAPPLRTPNKQCLTLIITIAVYTLYHGFVITGGGGGAASVPAGAALLRRPRHRPGALPAVRHGGVRGHRGQPAGGGGVEEARAGDLFPGLHRHAQGSGAVGAHRSRHPQRTQEAQLHQRGAGRRHLQEALPELPRPLAQGGRGGGHAGVHGPRRAGAQPGVREVPRVRAGAGAQRGLSGRPAGGDLAEGAGDRAVLPAELGQLLHEDRGHSQAAVELHEDVGGGGDRKRRQPDHIDGVQRDAEGTGGVLPDGLRAVQQQHRERPGPVPVPARGGVGDHRGGHQQDRGLQTLHHLLPLLQLRQDHQAGRHPQDLLHRGVRQEGQRQGLHPGVLPPPRRRQNTPRQPLLLT